MGWRDVLDGNDPGQAAAYKAGLDDGYALGYAEALARAEVELAAALTHAFGGNITRHIRALEQTERRRAWDIAAPVPRTTDRPGRAA